MAVWIVRVCYSAASKIDLQVGLNNTDNVLYATWHQGDGIKDFHVPNELGLDEQQDLYFRATTPEHAQTDLCVYHDGHCLEHFSFDGGDEDHQLSYGLDSDNCPCAPGPT